MKYWKISLVVAIIFFFGVVFLTCFEDDDEDDLTALQKALGKSVAKSYSSSLQAADSNHKYQDTQYFNRFGNNDCPEITWSGGCSWTFDYGTGCYGPLGNYFSVV